MSRNGLNSTAFSSFHPSMNIMRMVHSGGPLALARLLASWVWTAWLMVYATSPSRRFQRSLHSDGLRRVSSSLVPVHALRAVASASAAWAFASSGSARAARAFAMPSNAPMSPPSCDTASRATMPATLALAERVRASILTFGLHVRGTPFSVLQKRASNFLVRRGSADSAAPSTRSPMHLSASARIRATMPSASSAPSSKPASFPSRASVACPVLAARIFRRPYHMSAGRSCRRTALGDAIPLASFFRAAARTASMAAERAWSSSRWKSSARRARTSSASGGLVLASSARLVIPS